MSIETLTLIADAVTIALIVVSVVTITASTFVWAVEKYRDHVWASEAPEWVQPPIEAYREVVDARSLTPMFASLAAEFPSALDALAAAQWSRAEDQLDEERETWGSSW